MGRSAQPAGCVQMVPRGRPGSCWTPPPRRPGPAEDHADDPQQRLRLAPGMYSRGGLVVLSVATALGRGHDRWRTPPGSSMSRLLGVVPLRWVGVRSYGIYLWHFPVIALTTRSPTRLRAGAGQRCNAGHVRARRRRLLVALGRGPDPPRRPRPGLATGTLRAPEGRARPAIPRLGLGRPAGGRSPGDRDRGLRAQRRALDPPRDPALGFDPGRGGDAVSRKHSQPHSGAQPERRRRPPAALRGPPRRRRPPRRIRPPRASSPSLPA